MANRKKTKINLISDKKPYNYPKIYKEFQVDIYPLDPPRDNQADEIDQLALELGTAAVFGREQTLGKDGGAIYLVEISKKKA